MGALGYSLRPMESQDSYVPASPLLSNLMLGLYSSGQVPGQWDQVLSVVTRSMIATRPDPEGKAKFSITSLRLNSS